MRLRAPVRGVVYGLSLIVGAPLAWDADYEPVALLIGGIVALGITLEVLPKSRR